MFGNHRGRGGRGHGPHDHFAHFDEVRDGRGPRRRERLFDQGDLKLVVLNLLQAQPSHGYEIIKAIEELAGGEYTPSPGVIYPTLTLLEDIGHAAIAQESGGKKQYGITVEGRAFLESQGEVLARILERVASTGSAADARRAPELQRSMQNFRTALHFRLSRGPLSTDEVRKIAEAIDRAAVEIERS
jgi:DNA-binding PadR family transcriptional regulator